VRSASKGREEYRRISWRSNDRGEEQGTVTHPPENLPSVKQATSYPNPAPMIKLVGLSISGMPGPPLGPKYLSTTTAFSPFLKDTGLASEVETFLAGDLGDRAARGEVSSEDSGGGGQNERRDERRGKGNDSGEGGRTHERVKDGKGSARATREHTRWVARRVECKD
jgi:hypothetical protein